MIRATMKLAAVVVCLFLVRPILAADVRYDIEFPDLPGYQTLPCDLHMHTVFSDGSVWPPTRVEEAWRQGLDAIAITDHIEYQPHKADIPTNHNRPYDLMVGKAREMDLLLIRGAEITRDTPPGHFNAIFLQDATPLDTPDFVEAIKRANEQNAFVFWNHQGWKGEEKGQWLDVHTTLYENKWFQGMEVCNGDEYYPTAHKWCLEKNLTMLGNTDIHAPDLRERSTSANHRTMTLVFAKERTPDSLKEALLAGRTVVWFKDQLIGREQWLKPLLEQSVRIKPPQRRSKTAVWVEVQNRSSADIRVQRTDIPTPEILLPAESTVLVKIATRDSTKPLEVPCVIKNFLIAPNTGLPITVTIPGP